MQLWKYCIQTSVTGRSLLNSTCQHSIMWKIIFYHEESQKYLRNQINTSTFDALMRICIEGPPLSDFNFDMALNSWSK